MRVPLEWLREHCDPDLDVEGIEERLTMTGTKVEAVETRGVSALERFVVGRVQSVEPHPDADKLRVCEVDLGASHEKVAAQIVCGAPNVAAGQSVAVALPGAVMPDGTRLKAAKLRGVASEGMILAEDELAIGPAHEGILVLDELAAKRWLPRDVDLAPGTPLAEVLPIATEVLELEITPNRPDCLGVYGVARELHAATGAPLAPAPWLHDPAAGADEGAAGGGGAGGGAAPVGLRVEVRCPDLCPRFMARVFEEVTIAPSPPWLKARLSAAGQRPINNVVDITNYAMLLSGQPLHAFDLDRVAGGELTVRRARDGEELVTLDGQSRTLDGEMIVIEDAEGPTSLAGLMGGSRSEVSAGTRTVALEVANWHGPSIHHASWALGLRSEASSRFEKGLAPEQCPQALAVATKLMLGLCCARLRPGTIDVCEPLQAPARILLRSARVKSILGIEIPVARQREILAALDFGVPDAVGGSRERADGAVTAAAETRPSAELEVTVPPLRRNDVTREADLIEEVARIHGLERLPATLPARRGAYGLLSREQRLRRRVIDVLVGRGLCEVVGWTFSSPATAEKLRLPEGEKRRTAAVVVENPLSEEQSLLRTSLLPSLLEVAARNQARGAADLAIFEAGTTFRHVGDGRRPLERDLRADAIAAVTGVRERRCLGVLLRGRLVPPTWAARVPPRADFFAMKGLLETVEDTLGLAGEYEPSSLAFLHPGLSATVSVGGEEVGWLGELHPEVAESFDVGGGGVDGAAANLPVAMELDLDALIELTPEEAPYRDLISFPALLQDIAVTLPSDVPAAAVVRTVRDAAGAMLAQADVFDVYSGRQVGEGRRSLALSLSFRAPDRTLSDEDVEPVRERIIDALAALGGELRG
jgi:phenylalanyl-tRNA synthetase beta chain